MRGAFLLEFTGVVGPLLPLPDVDDGDAAKEELELLVVENTQQPRWDHRVQAFREVPKLRTTGIKQPMSQAILDIQVLVGVCDAGGAGRRSRAGRRLGPCLLLRAGLSQRPWDALSRRRPEDGREHFAVVGVPNLNRELEMQVFCVGVPAQPREVRVKLGVHELEVRNGDGHAEQLLEERRAEARCADGHVLQQGLAHDATGKLIHLQKVLRHTAAIARSNVDSSALFATRHEETLVRLRLST
mmetsp:Transcript_9745/g.36626  ORF Transcript_9745/g.36626 Transcript_9745/m.36626 type:complete len:243 (+) Transcript_9745:822-1550(+)